MDNSETVCGYYPDTTTSDETVNLLATALATGGNFFILPTNDYIPVSFYLFFQIFSTRLHFLEFLLHFPNIFPMKLRVICINVKPLKSVLNQEIGVAQRGKLFLVF